MADNSGPLKLFWPEIDDLPSAKAAARLGMTASILLSLFNAATATYAIVNSVLPFRPAQLAIYLDALVFAVLAVGIWRMSRVAAVLALLFFAAPQVVGGILAHRMVGLVIPVAGTLFLLSGVRGTILFRRFGAPAAQADAPDA